MRILTTQRPTISRSFQQGRFGHQTGPKPQDHAGRPGALLLKTPENEEDRGRRHVAAAGQDLRRRRNRRLRQPQASRPRWSGSAARRGGWPTNESPPSGVPTWRAILPARGEGARRSTRARATKGSFQNRGRRSSRSFRLRSPAEGTSRWKPTAMGLPCRQKPGQPAQRRRRQRGHWPPARRAPSPYW